MAKPAVLCKLTKGKIIDAHEGFVDTFNWMVDFISNLKGYGGIDISAKPSDRPKVRLYDIESGDYSNIEATVDDASKKIKIEVFYT